MKNRISAAATGSARPIRRVPMVIPTTNRPSRETVRHGPAPFFALLRKQLPSVVFHSALPLQAMEAGKFAKRHGQDDCQPLAILQPLRVKRTYFVEPRQAGAKRAAPAPPPAPPPRCFRCAPK